MAAEIFLLRHAQSQHNANGLMQGHIDSPLSEKGKDQARAAGVYLQKPFDAVYGSDLSRCKDTAKLILQRTNPEEEVPQDYRYELRERNLGELEGMKLTDARAMWAATGTTKHDYGEKGPAARRRAVDGFVSVIEDIKSKGYKRVLIVSHGSVIPRVLTTLHEERQLLLENMTADDIGVPHNTSITHLRIEPDGLVLDSYANSAHLEQARSVDPDLI